MTRWTLALIPLAALAALGCAEDEPTDTSEPGGEPACEEAELRCVEDDTILEECADGAWVEKENCAEQGMMCHLEMGHCMAM